MKPSRPLSKKPRFLKAPRPRDSPSEYRELRETVNELFRTLDVQGKIDGPPSIGLSRADAAARDRLARDPFADLSSGSAAALRAQMDRLVPVWIEYVTLTAVAG